MIQYGAMNVYRWSHVEEEQLNPLMTRKVIHTPRMTIARLKLVRCAVVPAHSHPQEQVTMLESGSLRFVLDGEERVLRAGEALEIPPHVEHSVEAIEDSVAMDVFSPARDDWQRGEDSYLRK